MIETQKDLYTRIEEACAYIQSHTSQKPEIAIILGTGLGDLAKRLKDKEAVPYESIPHFPQSTVESHAGQLAFGKIGEKTVAVMEGRFHFYEGYSLEQVTFPVRVLRKLGAETLIVSNAAGGMNLSYAKGDLVLITDQINMMGVNPLVGPNDNRLGIRFPDMSEPFSKALIDLAEKIAKSKDIRYQKGVYMGVSGPNLETKAEYRAFSRWADVVGMSTVPEVIVGVHAGFRILGISVITDICDPDHLKAVDIQEIIQVANEAGPKLIQLIESLIKAM
ncbi:MAG: purine-nucleoside phosphorylase [Candidatus Omnitrophica bacterium CG11_big_fil_rev_8_21_14_0_20_45_26]|uniref:Purine nucleoside phosphorylase n=1 Tax=Candidatus Abzuiibacterium crystallinum TaxID=1974748 RepID=A0A2H0LPW3_9BACT|nr:MAG: purine-nucleoside phosphorylase [Candidatus Omnitrophica bacterium CG11_big_fil_rev_8_21_14_0_20_45_26]PIW64185.1 MAG: purine-nucleoside phosphorylase [Candidatus Omnitrophica bacterium CG12_big_fil_rev_8_21_14_0_65_45_16]